MARSQSIGRRISRASTSGQNSLVSLRAFSGAQVSHYRKSNWPGGVLPNYRGHTYTVVIDPAHEASERGGAAV